MSTNRKIRPPYEQEKGRCSWCGTSDLPKGRRSWCSDKCVNDYKMVSDPGYIRSQVKKRDKGICAHCGEDCVALAKRLGRYRSGRWLQLYYWLGTDRYRELHSKRSRDYMQRLEARFKRAYRSAHQRLKVELFEKGFSRNRTTLWDADHIIPVIEGGGECGLDNYRTLCIPCHKKETKLLAGRRAAARRKK